MIRFVSFEGGDGSGKSTQIRALESYLIRRGRSCVVTCEPGGTSLGKLIRQVLLEVGDHEIAPSTELFLYLADRAQHVAKSLSPRLTPARSFSAIALPIRPWLIRDMAAASMSKCCASLTTSPDGGVRPDLTFLLDCPVALGLARTNQRGSVAGQPRQDRFEREKIEFHEKIRAGFLDHGARRAGALPRH